MNLRENWWKYLILAVVVVGLLWYRRDGTEDTPEVVTPNDDEVVEQQVDDFLRDRNISLPEGGDRANLRDQTDDGLTGVATRTDENELITVLADLPDPEAGNFYQAFLLSGDNDYLSLGRLRPAKGGYLLETRVDADLSGYDTVVISRETGEASEPSRILLRGNFQANQ